MERNDGNLFQSQAQVMAKNRTKVGKPPTRLQKKAPSCLQVNDGSTIYPFVPSAPAGAAHLTPIPLLSPLIVSPPPLPQEAEEFRFPIICGGDEKKSASQVFPEEGWEHPAVSNAYIEPSSLFSFFQSKCVIVNPAK